jgi:hypothetical protein
LAWHFLAGNLPQERSLKTSGCPLSGEVRRRHPGTQFSVGEPRENRGRLRHCNGLQTPIATVRTGGREGGSEVKPEVRIPAELCSSWLPPARLER